MAALKRLHVYKSRVLARVILARASAVAPNLIQPLISFILVFVEFYRYNMCCILNQIYLTFYY